MYIYIDTLHIYTQRSAWNLKDDGLSKRNVVSSFCTANSRVFLPTCPFACNVMRIFGYLVGVSLHSPFYTIGKKPPTCWRKWRCNRWVISPHLRGDFFQLSSIQGWKHDGCTPRKTKEWQCGQSTVWVDVSPIKKKCGFFPHCYVSFRGGTRHKNLWNHLA